MKKVIMLSVLCINTGCASFSPFELSRNGPTMAEHYRRHVHEQDSAISSATMSDIQQRPLENDINQVAAFHGQGQRIANPELEMFIYPHRSARDGVIIPGYTVSFPMYEKVHYRLSGNKAQR